jgi:hypothetical protein
MPSGAQASTMARDGLPSGLPFATAGEPRMHLPAPATPQVPAQNMQVQDVQIQDTQAQDTGISAQGMPSEAAPAPRSLADFALVGKDTASGGTDRGSTVGAPDRTGAPGMTGTTDTTDISGAPVLRILYNASTKGTLHPCPS